MILLAIDTSGLQGSLALAKLRDSKVERLQQVEWLKKAMHSEICTVKLQELIEKFGIELNQITHLAINVGPGSFTGLRVGISLAKTLAYTLSLPVAILNRLELLAARENFDGKIFVATKAVQNFYYVASFLKSPTGLETMLQPQSMALESVFETAKDCTKVLIEGQTAAFVAETQAKDLISYLTRPSYAPEFFSWKSVEPLYIRASEAEEKLKKGLLKPF